MEAFTASHNCLQQFRKRFNLHNRSVADEAASADFPGAVICLVDLHRIVKEAIAQNKYSMQIKRDFSGKMPEQTISTQKKQVCLYSRHSKIVSPCF